MTIVKENTRKMKEFKDIEIGDVFIEYNGEFEHIQMKVTPIVENNIVYNAVSMETGVMYHMEDDTEVEIIDPTLIIK